jgi:hypothetical protein
MLADKTASATVDGLNQKFILDKDKGRTIVKQKGDVSLDALGARILIQVSVDHIVDMIWEGKDDLLPSSRSFSELIHYFAETYEHDKKIMPVLGAKKCQHCEFKADKEQEANGYKSGFKECWVNNLKWSNADFEKPSIFELWNSHKKQTFMDNGKYFLSDLTEEDIGIKQSDGTGLSTTERQWLQIEKTLKYDNTIYFDIAGFKSEFKTWKFPLHFIDFETTAVAIPFNKGRRPYEGIAFQFSHHILNENGLIEHKGQFINTERGKFPNLDFIHALQSELDLDDGTIFRYAAHENTFLNIIVDQLKSTDEPDKDELCAWIKTISESRSDSVEKWEGKRNMVDMLELVKKYYYNPLMKGSNSIKAVLPAVMKTSDFLKDKYSKPVYGSEAGIKSHNFQDWTWYQVDENGVPKDPYKLLPNLFSDILTEELENFITDSNLSDGGAAMTAYAKMQFMEMSELERQNVVQGLLKYCELDTMAMVMIMEDWFSLLVKEKI